MKKLLLLAATITALPGCFWVTTKSEGQSLRRDVNALDSRVSTKEAELGGKVDELQKTLDEAAKLLKRNSADIGAEVQRIDEEQRKLLGLLTAAQTGAEEVRVGFERYKQSNDERLAALEARLLQLEGGRPGGTTGGTASADDLWNAGKTAFEAKKYADAREAFKKLALGFPTHARADDAQYFRAETYFAEKQWDSAIGEYQKVFDKHADSDLADDALFRAGEAAEKLKNCTEARAYFGLIKSKYPKSSLAKKAGDKDKSLKAAAKDKKKCTS
jgi:tol-pal system protein YbgF